MSLIAPPAVPAPGEDRPEAAVLSPAGAVVLDTSVLLADPESIFGFGDADVVLPLKVIEELDGHKSRMDDVGRAARAAARLIEQLRTTAAEGDLRTPVPLPAGGTLRVVINGVNLAAIEHLSLDVHKADNRILAAALGLKTRNPGAPVRLVSADVNLRLKASAVGLNAEEYVQTRPGFHTEAHPGWHELEVSAGLIDALYRDSWVGLDELPPAELRAVTSLAVNEYAVLTAGRQSALARRHPDRLSLLRARDGCSAWGMRPRSKEQQFALDLLLDPGVGICGLSGKAGTGKTMLAIAAGLEQVFEPEHARYDRLMIIRPMIAVGRQEVGFLPGDLKEKLDPWFSTVEDTMTALREDKDRTAARKQLEMWVAEGRVDMQPVTYLRGRSLHKTYVVLDEAQNLELGVLKTVLTRAGDGSKIVLVGDVSQIDNPFVSERTSAISILADRFAGRELFGHLLLTKGERSPVADLAAELL